MSGGWQPGQPYGRPDDERNPFGQGPEPAQYPVNPPYPQQPPYEQQPPAPGQQPPYPQQPPYQQGPPPPYQQQPPQQGNWAPPPAGPPRRSKAPLVIGLVAVLVLVLCGGAGLGGYAIYRHSRPTDSDSDHGTGSSSAAAGTSYPRGARGMGQGWEVGNLTGSKKIEIYEDLACPPCKTVHQATQPTINSLITASGNEWDVVYYPIAITGGAARRAANAFACTGVVGSASQSDALGYQDALFEHQTGDESGGFTANDLIDAAPSVYHDNTDFTDCVRADTYDGWVTSLGTAASKRGVESTPTVFVNGKKLDQDSLTADSFKSAVSG